MKNAAALAAGLFYCFFVLAALFDTKKPPTAVTFVLAVVLLALPVTGIVLFALGVLK
jgi:hypothetical protein